MSRRRHPHDVLPLPPTSPRSTCPLVLTLDARGETRLPGLDDWLDRKRAEQKKSDESAQLRVELESLQQEKGQ